MNTKVLASLGVIAALLTAWLFIALFSATSVTVNDGAQDAPAEFSAGEAEGATTAGESAGVTTSVNVANQDVTTKVKVAE